MKLALAAALTVGIAAPALAQGERYVDETSFIIGPTWGMGGPSPLEEKDFRQDFDTGFSWTAVATGPIAEMIGWRAELGHESLPADADRAAGKIEGDYTLLRFQIGLQLTPFQTTGRGRPYFFFTMGLARQDASAESTNDDGAKIEIDFDGTSNFGLSFGGGYNYLIGERWGVGGDVHINTGLFADGTRWWWTPGAQVFYRW